MKTTPMHPSEFQNSDLPLVVFSFFRGPPGVDSAGLLRMDWHFRQL